MVEYIRDIKLTLEVDTNKRTLTSVRELHHLSGSTIKAEIDEMIQEVEI